MRLSPVLLLTLFCAAHAQDYPATRSAYLDMLDSDGNGRLSAAEYVDYMSAGFRGMDSNGDGIIDRSELPGGRGQPITAQENRDNLRRQFHRLDSNHDGYLDPRELTAPPR